ncbi:DUF4355 domain-containing protein [Lentilactobacillus senioris]|uniref:DUF4355 domain-containing protein n=1 Tax=Lentilactobacillus senioris TaxID=931534 RepID=UPI003D2850A6
MKKFKLPMNLQYFAEDGGDNPTPPADLADNTQPNGDDVQGDKGDNSKPELKYSDDDVDRIINQKFAKWKEEQAAKADEAEKLKGMNGQQKKDYELEQANKAKDAAAAELARYKMRDQARSMLSEAGVSITDDDLEHIVTPEAESTTSNVDWLKDLHGRIEQSVKTKFLQGNPPRVGGEGLNQDSKSSYGKRLAQLSPQSNKNPYFKN